MPDHPGLLPQTRTDIAHTAESIMLAGLKCVVEVRDERPGTASGWEPRLALLSADAPPERAVAAVEDTMRIWPDVDVRLAAYTPCRLRRVDDFPARVCRHARRRETSPASGYAAA